MPRTRKQAEAAPARRELKKDVALPCGAPPVGELPATPPRPAEPGGRSEPRFSALLDARLPLVLSAVNAGYVQHGLAAVVVARRVGRSVVCAHFIVDLLAFGVVECYGETFGAEEFARYLDDLETRVPLESCPIATATAIVREGAAWGEQNGFGQPEPLAFWERLLPEPPPGGSETCARETEARIFGPMGRPLAVSEILNWGGPREDGPWIPEAPPEVCVVRSASATEH